MGTGVIHIIRSENVPVQKKFNTPSDVQKKFNTPSEVLCEDGRFKFNMMFFKIESNIVIEARKNRTKCIHNT